MKRLNSIFSIALCFFLFLCSGCQVRTQSLMEITNSIGMKLKSIPKGTFTMGSPIEEEGGNDVEEQHQVTISKEYYLGVYEVTQGQYEKVMGTNPSYFQKRVIRNIDSLMYPVEQVSWDDAVEFCKRLSELPEEKKAGRVYRLPTEAEWEYACRAGSKTAYSFGESSKLLGDYGWYGGNSDNQSHPVGEKKPNAWGLYDMQGNVQEWCSDWYGVYPNGAVTDPVGPREGSYRVIRGSSALTEAASCRSADRSWLFPFFIFQGIGFRVVLNSSENPNELPERRPEELERSLGGAVREWLPDLGMKFCWCPAGSFVMGSPGDEVGRTKDETQHAVRLTRGYWLGQTEVTRGQFSRFVSAMSYVTECEQDGKGGSGFDSLRKWSQNPGLTWRNPGFAQTDDHPVVNVSWNDADAFCRWLSAREGMRYRLPTEAEWEYACRAGSSTAYSFGNDSKILTFVGNVRDATAKAKYPDLFDPLPTSDGYVYTSPVGVFLPNAWGLHDMHGNVSEWCADWSGDYGDGSVVDPAGLSGPSSGSRRFDFFRVSRGGDWNSRDWNCRAASRNGFDPSDRSGSDGFRLALDSSAR